MAKPDFGPTTMKPVASHTPIKRGVMDAMKKATSIGPQIRSPKESIRSAKSIGPAIIGSDAPDEFRSPLSAKTIPDLMAQYGVGLDLSNIDNAGLPFISMRSAIKGGEKVVNPVYRGAARARETLDPAFYKIDDTLGWMTHAAENPQYADQYSIHGTKAYPVTGEENTPVLREHLTDYRNRQLQPWTQPIVLRNKNTLDLINPNWDDLSQAVASLPDYERARLVKNHKETIQSKIEGYNWAQPDKELSGSLRETYREPDLFKRSPFDAIRYNDAGEPSWAFPEETLNTAVTPWGVPINKETIGRKYPAIGRPRFLVGPEGIIENPNPTAERLQKLVSSHDNNSALDWSPKQSAESQAFSAKGPIPKGPNWGPSTTLENEAAKVKPYLDNSKFEGNAVLSKEAYENPHDFNVTTKYGTTTPFANWLEKTVQNYSGFYKYPSELLDSIKEFPQVWDWLTIHKPK
jgi:hypothetical protein